DGPPGRNSRGGSVAGGLHCVPPAQRLRIRRDLVRRGKGNAMPTRKTQRTTKSTTGSPRGLKISSRRPASREPEFGGMTVREAGRKGGLIGGRKGGLAVKAERGREFYQEIGRKGGETVKAERGRSFYEQIGKKGGDTVKAERGAGFYEQIGKKGGDAVKAERGTPFYEEIGKKGGHKVRQLIEEGKK